MLCLTNICINTLYKGDDDDDGDDDNNNNNNTYPNTYVTASNKLA